MSNGPAAHVCDKIDDEATANIVTWATLICSFQEETCPHPFKLFFDDKSQLFSTMPKVYSKITVLEKGTIDEPESVQNFGKHVCVVSPSFVRNNNVVRCLAPKLKDCDLEDVGQAGDRIPSACDSLLMDVFRYCKDLKSLKLSVPCLDINEFQSTFNLV